MIDCRDPGRRETARVRLADRDHRARRQVLADRIAPERAPTGRRQVARRHPARHSRDRRTAVAWGLAEGRDGRGRCLVTRERRDRVGELLIEPRATTLVGRARAVSTSTTRARRVETPAESPQPGECLQEHPGAPAPATARPHHTRLPPIRARLPAPAPNRERFTGRRARRERRTIPKIRAVSTAVDAVTRSTRQSSDSHSDTRVSGVDRIDTIARLARRRRPVLGTAPAAQGSALASNGRQAPARRAQSQPHAHFMTRSAARITDVRDVDAPRAAPAPPPRAPSAAVARSAGAALTGPRSPTRRAQHNGILQEGRSGRDPGSPSSRYLRLCGPEPRRWRRRWTEPSSA